MEVGGAVQTLWGTLDSHRDSEPGPGEPTQTSRDYWGPTRDFKALIGLIWVPRLLWVGLLELFD